MAKSYILVVAVCLGLAGEAQGSRVVGSSSYGSPLDGESVTCPAPFTCDIASDVLTSAAQISPEAFVSSSFSNSSSSNSSDFVVFDFKIDNTTLSNFTLDLTATGDGVSIAQDNPSSNRWGYGAFTPPLPNPGGPTPPQSGPDPSAVLSYGSVTTNTISFQVNGQNMGYDFYVVLYDPRVCPMDSLLQSTCVSPAATVTATIGPSAVPEPRFTSLLWFSLLAPIVVLRRRPAR